MCLISELKQRYLHLFVFVMHGSIIFTCFISHQHQHQHQHQRVSFLTLTLHISSSLPMSRSQHTFQPWCASHPNRVPFPFPIHGRNDMQGIGVERSYAIRRSVSIQVCQHVQVASPRQEREINDHRPRAARSHALPNRCHIRQAIDQILLMCR
jgi:hypothetical protein